MSVEHTEENVAVKGRPRRVVVKSAAWSLPVFAAVAVTPAFAASTSPAIVSEGDAGATRTGKDVAFSWAFTKASDVTISSISIATDSTTGNAKFDGPTTNPPPASPVEWQGSNQNAHNTTTPGFTITIAYTRASTPGVTQRATVLIAASTGFASDAELGASVTL